MKLSRWLVMSGHSWETWNTWYEKGIMAYGWGDRIGNFKDYNSPESIQKALKQYNTDHPEVTQGATTYSIVSKEIWQFSREIKIGDIIYVKGKNNTIVGRGIVDSEHIYDSTFDDKHGYSNIRKVQWSPKVVGKYPSEKNTSNRALLNITDWTDDFLERLDTLFDVAEENEHLAEEIEKACLQGATREAVVKVRVNQGRFRERLIHKYGKCCLCNVNHLALLRASHIKPWSVSSSEEQLDVDNGLLLCPNHDALFDGGYISFDGNGKILISDSLKHIDKVSMNIRSDMKIELNERNEQYMDYHRREIFH